MLRRLLTLIVHLVAAIVPMLAGWGFRDLSGFVTEPARVLLLVAVLSGAAAVLFLRIDLNPLRNGSPGTRGESWSLAFLALASVALLWLLPFTDRHCIMIIPGPGVRWIGLLMTCAGGLVRILALHQLGKQFSAYVTLQPGHELVQSGIYSVVRHPLYLSLLLAGPGVALLFASQLVWPILLATAVFIAHRIQVEESLLARHFGRRFLVYRLRSRMLIPLLW
jgi:protein-S-isoprenylcysteine O-methyltransferase Ste14